MTLSAIVITKNAGKKLERCLESLKFSDEIIVVDSGSTDETLEIAKKQGTSIIKTTSASYADSRNFGAKHSKCEWLLYIDSDEIVGENLRNEILKRINPLTHQPISAKGRSAYGGNSFRIYRKNIILGKWLRRGGWWPDPVHRLIKKSALVRWEGGLHEHPKVKGEIGVIAEPILHYAKDSVGEMVENSKIFAPIEARLWFEAKHPPVWVYHVLLAMWREFWNRGIKGFGWLDGPVGILTVFYQMFHKVLVYGTLWEMQQASKYTKVQTNKSTKK